MASHDVPLHVFQVLAIMFLDLMVDSLTVERGKTMISLKGTVEKIKALKGRSHVARAINEDAIKLLENLMEDDKIDQIEDWFTLIHRLWNGADFGIPSTDFNYSYKCWKKYSYGGCALVSDYDIAKRYCTPAVFKKKREGQLRPNRKQDWLDVQADALRIAQDTIYSNLVYV